jgi:hypothetical protein
MILHLANQLQLRGPSFSYRTKLESVLSSPAVGLSEEVLAMAYHTHEPNDYL